MMPVLEDRDPCCGMRQCVMLVTATDSKYVCNFPGCESEGKYRCTCCHSAYYCGKAHQETDWKAHKKVCSILKAVVETKANKKIMQLIDNHGEGFGGQTAEMAKNVKERMVPESNARRNE